MADRERSPPKRAVIVIHGDCRQMTVEELNIVYQVARQRRIRAMLAMGRFTRIRTVVVDYPFLNMPYVLTYGPLPVAALAAE